MATASQLERLWIGAQERGLGVLDRLAAKVRPGAAAAPHLVTGERGERAALFELRRRGVAIVARRWTSARVRGDLDLVGWDGGTLCFIEVKTRSVRDVNPAETQVDETKRRMLRSLARIYLKSFPAAERASIPVRFDVVAVYLPGARPEFEVFTGAFGW